LKRTFHSFKELLIPLDPDKVVKEYTLLSLLLAIAVCTIFAQAWQPLSDSDSLSYWTVARNVLETGKLVPLTFTKQYFPRFYEHPPLFFWMQAGWYKLVGDGVVQSRLLPGILGFLLLLLVYGMGKRFGGLWAGFFAGLVLLGSPRFLALTSQPRLEIPLALCVTLGIWGLVRLDEGGWRPWLIVGAATGLGILTRGPVGLTPLAVLLIWVIATGKWRLLTGPKLWVAVVLSFLPFGLWLMADGRLVLEGYLKHQILNTMVTGSNKEVRGVEYYFLAMAKQYWPWLPFFLLGLWMAVKKQWMGKGLIFSALAIAVIFIGLNLSRGKSVHYLMPVYPLAAIFAGVSLAALLSERTKRYFLNGIAIAVVVLLFVLIAFPIKIKATPNRESAALFSYIEKYVPRDQTVYVLGGQRHDWELLTQIIAYPRREAIWLPVEYFQQYPPDSCYALLLVDPTLRETLAARLSRFPGSVQSGPFILYSDNLPAGNFVLPAGHDITSWR
jgi:4-amino-4-deoxy-L-arabinose transferase-like glycosyltransferase